MNPAAAVAEGDDEVGRSASDLAGWLEAHPGLETSERKAASVGGLSGWWLEIAVQADGGPVEVFDRLPFEYFVTFPGRERIYLLDAPSGKTVMISVWASDAASFSPLLAEALPIIDTIQFGAG